MTSIVSAAWNRFAEYLSERNASTSTVRLCGSSGTNPFAAIAAGLACLWGPAHGGANEACLLMLEDIQRMGGVDKVGEFISQV